MVAPNPASESRAKGLNAAIQAALARDASARGGAAAPRVSPWTLGVDDQWAALIVSVTSRRHRQALRALATAVPPIPVPVVELGKNDVGVFIPGRRFRADIAWPALRVYVEVDGGTFMRAGGKHARGSGIHVDCEKASLAAAHGWRLIRVDSKWLNEDIREFVEWVRAALTWRAPSSGASS